MNATAILRHALRNARLRRGLDAALLCLPWLAIALTLTWRLGGAGAALALFVVGGVAIAAFSLHRARRLDTRWLVRELDAQRADMEDSSDLLFAPAGEMTTLERLQLARLQRRIETAGAPDLRPRWSARAIALAAGVASLAIAAILLWPARQPVTIDNVLSRLGAAPAAPTQPR